MRAYVVQAIVNGTQVPTFYLPVDLQGIVSKKHAIRIALDVLRVDPDDDVSIIVAEVTL